MRYIAKLHVLDVMDQIVVSGYVHGDGLPWSDGEPPFEFSWQIPGRGLNNAYDWLLDALSRALPDPEDDRLAARPSSGRMGGPHTVSETGDSPASVMG